MESQNWTITKLLLWIGTSLANGKNHFHITCFYCEPNTALFKSSCRVYQALHCLCTDCAPVHRVIIDVCIRGVMAIQK
jgi:hypothetical protein